MATVSRFRVQHPGSWITGTSRRKMGIKDQEVSWLLRMWFLAVHVYKSCFSLSGKHPAGDRFETQKETYAREVEAGP